MAENKVQDYTDNTDEGHVDTREQNFECEKPDKNLGCDLWIDVQGQRKRQSLEYIGKKFEPKKGRASNEALPFF